MRLILILTLWLISACGQQPIDGPSTPENTTLGFFQAIYIDKDVEAATRYVTPELAEVLRHYHLATQIQRYVLSLPMTNVSLDIMEVDLDFFRKSADETTVTIKLEGLKGDRPWIDDRIVRMKKIKNRWIITEFIHDKYSRG
ncbi:hypothetical protein [Shewanella sp. NIFS-20-20]|uniref:hypothetical protein n=1 Tax=Shewanella sp. NIFS-20-20 TaxID=2853806 RepID=UPI001C4411C4|nr:hypothetical protein [Shewanella sp. NIFS-20-20]MBV7316863.1 hypothetical protein [Shewanella sp. NIFS-20-20]